MTRNIVLGLIESALRDTCEAEALEHAGEHGDTYRALLDAHIALLKACNLQLAKERRHHAVT